MGKHRAFSVGIQGRRPALDDPDASRARPLLPYAPAVSAALLDELAHYQYADCRTEHEPTAKALAQVLTEEVSRPGTVVVHVLAHAEVHNTTRGLHLVGGDGERTPLDVEDLLKTVERQPDGAAPDVLFVLDVCYAGGAVWLDWQQQLRADRRHTWIVAASPEGEVSYDGRLTQAFTEVLGRFRTGGLRVDPSLEFIPLPAIARHVGQRVKEFGAPLQRIETTRVALDEPTDRVPFFPNPRYQPEFRASLLVDAAAATLLDEAVDVRHFTMRAGGAQNVFGEEVRHGFFWGRDAELGRLSLWLADPDPAAPQPALQVVTGKPGVGKSALLGALVCGAHPGLRSHTEHLWARLVTVPPVVPDLAVVHARQRGIHAVTHALARQWHLPGSDDGALWTADRLVDALAAYGAGARPTAIVDAVDEAERPEELAVGLLARLASGTRPDGTPLCRLLVGVRPEERFAPLLDQARRGGGLLDLADTPAGRLRQSLSHYAAQLLRHDNAYASGAAYVAAGQIADGIAAALTAVEGPSAATGGDAAANPWGEFLMTALYVRYVLDRDVETNPVRARVLGAAVPLELRDILALDLAQHADVPWLGPVLSALAFAKGDGMPEEIVAAEAGAFAPDGSEPTLDEIRTTLDAGRFYLRRGVEPEFGSTLYRLFHQGLADQLKARPCGYGGDWDE